MADINKTIKQLEADIDRAKRTGEILVYVGRATAKDCLELLKAQNEKILTAKEIIIDEMTNASWRNDTEAWKVLDRIFKELDTDE